MADKPHTGRLVIISGPSGAGKSTVVRGVLERCVQPLRLSVSATTRAPRPGEQDGVDYHFLTKAEFARRRDAGDFLEWKEVHNRGDWYGTLRKTVEEGLAAGEWMLLEIDVEGTLSILETHPDAITIFIHCGSVDELEQRLRGRGTETETSLQKRLAAARKELAFLERYKHAVRNDDRDDAVRQVCDILQRYAR
jgi:guanylate kinase